MTEATRLILASGSAIRREIMDGAGLDFEVIARPVDEAAIKAAMLGDGARPRDIADALAEAKALRVSRQEPGLVVGADQVMVMDGTLFDKPETAAAARDRLRAMRGRRHELVGAVVVARGGAPVWRHVSETRLWMRDFSDAFLEDYLAREGDLVTKSVGAYRFEGPGAQLFDRVDGDFFSILGLSLLPLLHYLRDCGAIPA
ncbi:Maf family protein [uncultured Algimonas sp.]|uniref:Maf family protein n=1 Tax=uncultured Algimonas sp. TaxID=1547920 RepID=UPI0026326CB3|nr:Maf family protein [uncultured Algimonas sp.]